MRIVVAGLTAIMLLFAAVPASAYSTYSDWNNATSSSQVTGNTSFFDTFAKAFRDLFGLSMGKKTWTNVPTYYGVIPPASITPSWIKQQGINPNTRRFYQYPGYDKGCCSSGGAYGANNTGYSSDGLGGSGTHF